MNILTALGSLSLIFGLSLLMEQPLLVEASVITLIVLGVLLVAAGVQI